MTISLALWAGWSLYTKPKAIPISAEKIIIDQEPNQNDDIDHDTFTVKVEDGEVVIYPIAEYQISALAVSRKNYYFSFSGQIVPTDLALAWGKLADSNYNQDITYSQSNRWYYYQRGADAKLDGKYIDDHSANNHIIPASENIKKAVKKIKKNQAVKIEGYLVNLDAKSQDIEFSQNTSTTRTDSGAGACEIIYATSIQIDNKIFK